MRGRCDTHYLTTGKITSAVLSLMMMIGAVLFHLAKSKTLVDTSIIVTAIFGGGIAGAFFFGIFTSIGDYRAVFAGIVATLILSGYAALTQLDILPRTFDPYYTGILANCLMFGVCLIAAKCFKTVPRDLSQLTIWCRDKSFDGTNVRRISMLAALLGGSLISTQYLGAEEPRHVVVYRQAGEFAGWPANEGLWSWGDEILVGFNVAQFEERGDKHSFTGKQSVAFARSLDGGRTWATERHINVVPPASLGNPELSHRSPGEFDFSGQSFAMKLRGSFFYVSNDRGRAWLGPYRIPDFGQSIDARTSYIVTGPKACLFFIPCTLSDGRGTRIRSCVAETSDGGRTFHFLSWLSEDPLDEAAPGVKPIGDDISSTMPSVVQLDDQTLVCALRNRIKSRKWSSIHESRDGGRTWSAIAVLEKGATNPVSLVRLDGRRIMAVYGNRRQVPSGVSAKISDDGGHTWSEERTLRNDGRKWDIGYTRAAVRTDGGVVAVYYFANEQNAQQYIEATLFRL